MTASGVLRPPVLFGWFINDTITDDLFGIIKLIESLGISFLVLNLNKCKNVVKTPDNEDFVPLGGSDLALPSGHWAQRVVSFISKSDLDALKFELSWASYVGVRSIIVDLASVLAFESDEDIMDRIAKLSQVLISSLSLPNTPTIHIALDASHESWNIWRMIYELCNHSHRLKVALILSDLDEDEAKRWTAEPLGLAILDSKSFAKSGYKCVISENVRNLLAHIMDFGVKVVLHSEFDYRDLIREFVYDDLGDKITNVPLTVREAIKAVKRLHASLNPLSIREFHSSGYNDLLQTPLQPLRDHLDSSTYEEFERCDTKYDIFETAVRQWLEENTTVRRPVAYIPGAGRGPLVQRTLNAFHNKGIKDYSIYAIEKNPYAILTLKHRIKDGQSGWDKVQLIFGDMRDIIPKEPADLIISELLGSFADNELSPECIYGIEAVFNKHFPNHKQIQYIPQRYTSFLTPIYTPKLWERLYLSEDRKCFHTPYVVALQSYYNIAANPDPLPCFSFEHPSRKETTKLERYKQLRFTVKKDCTLHGFAGYFSFRLYGDLEMSILPGHSDEVKSWFPMYFPVEKAMYVKESQVITLHIWRKCDGTRVWYEWAVTTPFTSAIHNVNGFSYSIAC
ncbi:Skb1 methyltransferase family member protein [Theileria equi strain WA]|uniref:Protein arginine N-methyltransferase n=1 Tax=Theileria equi strain WA TaxID=1537102 RepID=L0B063_THEEQ|nr:Skb1 methyltransferase family member protein [Theileria equi strain WA]AFZ80519.1 Skb1 methyltransferase family member protein [Theileria equi strain WA]|eukprot:XP_004830185.1 Skb1 methyltransferase family member protein [Theileria equi strain WA]